MSNDKRMLMLEAYLFDTNQTKKEYDTNTKDKNDDNTCVPIVIPLIKKQIKCSQLKTSQKIVYENKIWIVKLFMVVKLSIFAGNI